MDVTGKRQLVIDWCASIGVNARRISGSDAVLYLQGDGTVCFRFRQFDVNDEGHRELCRDCPCGCESHYHATRRELHNLPAPEFWTSGTPTLNLGHFAAGH